MGCGTSSAIYPHGGSNILPGPAAPNVTAIQVQQQTQAPLDDAQHSPSSSPLPLQHQSSSSSSSANSDSADAQSHDFVTPAMTPMSSIHGESMDAAPSDGMQKSDSRNQQQTQYVMSPIELNEPAMETINSLPSTTVVPITVAPVHPLFNDIRMIFSGRSIGLCESSQYLTTGRAAISLLEETYVMWNSYRHKTDWLNEFITYLKYVEYDLVKGLQISSARASTSSTSSSFLFLLESELRLTRGFISRLINRNAFITYLQSSTDEIQIKEHQAKIEKAKQAFLFSQHMSQQQQQQQQQAAEAAGSTASASATVSSTTPPPSSSFQLTEIASFFLTRDTEYKELLERAKFGLTDFSISLATYAHMDELHSRAHAYRSHWMLHRRAQKFQSMSKRSLEIYIATYLSTLIIKPQSNFGRPEMSETWEAQKVMSKSCSAYERMITGQQENVSQQQSKHGNTKPSQHIHTPSLSAFHPNLTDLLKDFDETRYFLQQLSTDECLEHIDILTKNISLLFKSLEKYAQTSLVMQMDVYDVIWRKMQVIHASVTTLHALMNALVLQYGVGVGSGTNPTTPKHALASGRPSFSSPSASPPPGLILPPSFTEDLQAATTRFHQYFSYFYSLQIKDGYILSNGKPKLQELMMLNVLTKTEYALYCREFKEFYSSEFVKIENVLNLSTTSPPSSSPSAAAAAAAVAVTLSAQQQHPPHKGGNKLILLKSPLQAQQQQQQQQVQADSRPASSLTTSIFLSFLMHIYPASFRATFLPLSSIVEGKAMMTLTNASTTEKVGNNVATAEMKQQEGSEKSGQHQQHNNTDPNTILPSLSIQLSTHTGLLRESHSLVNHWQASQLTEQSIIQPPLDDKLKLLLDQVTQKCVGAAAIGSVTSHANPNITLPMVPISKKGMEEMKVVDPAVTQSSPRVCLSIDATSLLQSFMLTKQDQPHALLPSLTSHLNSLATADWMTLFLCLPQQSSFDQFLLQQQQPPSISSTSQVISPLLIHPITIQLSREALQIDSHRVGRGSIMDRAPSINSTSLRRTPRTSLSSNSPISSRHGGAGGGMHGLGGSSFSGASSPLEIEAFLVQLCAKHLNIPDASRLALSSSLIGDLHATEMNLVEMVVALESRFHLTIPDVHVARFHTIGDIHIYIITHVH